MSGHTELDETLHIQHPFKGTKPFPEPEEWGKKKKKKKDEKKAKMADCTETPSKRLNTVLY